MKLLTFPEWLLVRYRKGGKYVNNRFGDLARDLMAAVASDPFGEDFQSYRTLEDWLNHLEMHVAPGSVMITMNDAWDLYASQGLGAEVTTK